MDTPEGDRHQSESNENIEQPPAPVERPHPTVNDPTGNNQRKKKEKNWPQRVEAVCAVLLILITGTYTWYTRGQLRLTREAIRQSRADNANALIAQQGIAQNALTASQENFMKSLKSSDNQSRLDQRAWVGHIDSSVSEVKEEAPITFKITLSNSGKTPALRVRTEISSAHGPATANFIPRYTKPTPQMRRGVGVIQPGGKAVIEQKTGPVTYIEKLRDGANLYYVFGRIDYEDIFGRPHWTTYCLYIGGEPTLSLMFQCRSYNDVDKEQVAKK